MPHIHTSWATLFTAHPLLIHCASPAQVLDSVATTLANALYLHRMLQQARTDELIMEVGCLVGVGGAVMLAVLNFATGRVVVRRCWVEVTLIKKRDEGSAAARTVLQAPDLRSPDTGQNLLVQEPRACMT